MANGAVVVTNSDQALAQAREALLRTADRKRLPITYKGFALELIQPTIGEIENMRVASEEDSGKTTAKIDGFVRIMIRFAVLPGTNVHPLTDEDADSLREDPWNADVVKIVEAFGKLSDIDVSGEAKNSDKTAS